jgi:tripartite-type tricarboxylate transporter receptor subunit TctC
VSESLGQQIVVENMGGAGGMTGSNRVAKAAPDGYLLVLGNAGTHAYNQWLYKRSLYNSESDFAPVGVVVENTKVLIVRNDFPANSLPEFVAYLQANRPSCNTARRAPAPPRISLACCSITAWARMSPMFPTAALGRRCRT